MSFDLVVLTPGSARDYESALKVYYEEARGAPDEETLQSFADELDRRYRDTWPWAGEPIVMQGFVLLTVTPEAWENVVPEVAALAQERGLVVLDPQHPEERHFPPGTPYEP